MSSDNLNQNDNNFTATANDSNYFKNYDIALSSPPGPQSLNFQDKSDQQVNENHHDSQNPLNEQMQEIIVRQVNGNPLWISIPSRQLATFTVGMLKPLVASKIGCPVGVVKIVDIDVENSDLGYGDDMDYDQALKNASDENLDNSERDQVTVIDDDALILLDGVNCNNDGSLGSKGNGKAQQSDKKQNSNESDTIATNKNVSNQKQMNQISNAVTNQFTAQHCRNLLAIVQNKQFGASLADMLTRRSTSNEDVQIIIYQIFWFKTRRPLKMPKSMLNIVDEATGDTLLHKYTREERLSICEALVSAVPRFGRINDRNNNGETVLHTACLTGNTKIAATILSCPYFLNFGALDQNENTAFHYACFKNKASLKSLFAPLLLPYRKEFEKQFELNQVNSISPNYIYSNYHGGSGDSSINSFGFMNSLDCIVRSNATPDEIELARLQQQAELEAVTSDLKKQVEQACDFYVEDSLDMSILCGDLGNQEDRVEGSNESLKALKEKAKVKLKIDRDQAAKLFNYLVRHSSSLQDFLCDMKISNFDDHMEALQPLRMAYLTGNTEI